ncbi:MAG: 2-hydroxychromene-2-carboxylate isomerase [Brucellaceae bacterium]|nr:2-hydroxychromene-2-carboxylate isomerase [Brucellaceae bacterium]
MPATIDYYFTSASPFVYLGHQPLRAVAAKHKAGIQVKPVNLAGVWEVSGAVMLAKRPPVRQRYRLVELGRIADFRGVPINRTPKFFPVDPALADHTVIALVEAGKDPLGYMEGVFAAVWANEKNIADEDTLAGLLEAEGFDAGAILSAARGPGIAEIRARNTAEAVEADIVGVPGYVLNGEPFWGQDRVEHLDHALATGREAFTA